MTITNRTLTTTAPDGTPLLSHIALPNDTTKTGKARAILVAPEWWGVADHPKQSPNVWPLRDLWQWQWMFMVRVR